MPAIWVPVLRIEDDRDGANVNWKVPGAGWSNKGFPDSSLVGRFLVANCPGQEEHELVFQMNTIGRATAVHRAHRCATCQGIGKKGRVRVQKDGRFFVVLVSETEELSFHPNGPNGAIRYLVRREFRNFKIPEAPEIWFEQDDAAAHQDNFHLNRNCILS